MDTHLDCDDTPPPYRPPSPAPIYRTVDSRVSERPISTRLWITAHIRNVFLFPPSRPPPPPPVPGRSVQTKTPTFYQPARVESKGSGDKPANRESSQTILAKARSAIDTNDEKLLRNILSHKFDANACLDDGSRLIPLAADLDRASIVEALLKSDADVLVLDRDGYTALHRAKPKPVGDHPDPAQAGFEDIVRALFSKFQEMQESPYLLDPKVLHLWINFGCLYAADRGHHVIAAYLHSALSDVPMQTLTRYNGMQILASAIKHN
ncbi:hypothetical protein BJX64DRAFT_294881 [Aspergillus heterothallicus]